MRIMSRRQVEALKKSIRFDFKIVLLAGLFTWTVAPDFRTDEFSKYLSFIGAVSLTIMAALWMFKKPSLQNKLHDKAPPANK